MIVSLGLANAIVSEGYGEGDRTEEDGRVDKGTGHEKEKKTIFFSFPGTGQSQPPRPKN
jgi:hypothetical protein